MRLSSLSTILSVSILGTVSLLGAGLCVGCRDTVNPAGNSDSARDHATSAKPSLPADSRPVIVCFGDSLTAGFGTEPGEAYPERLQELLDAQGYHYRVVNAGISGETTKDGLERVKRVVARRPRIVVLEFGGNDGLRGLPLEQTETNLASMIEQLQASGVEVAMAGITLPPEYGQDYIAKINAIYPALAKRYHLRLLPFLLKDVYGVPGDMQEDGHHATAKGNRQVAITVSKLIQPMLKR